MVSNTGSFNVNLGGFFAGGAAKGFESGRKLQQTDVGLGQAQQGLQQEQARDQAAQQKQTRDEVEKRIRETIAQAQNLSQRAINARASKIGGTDTEAEGLELNAEKAFESARRLNAQFEAIGGESFAVLIDTAMVKQQSARQKAQEAGGVKAAGAVSEQTSLRGQGLSPGELEAAGGAKVIAPKAPVEQFEPVLDGAGNIVGQQSTTTGKVVSDPRAVKESELKPSQRLAAIFALREQSSSQVIDELGGQFVGVQSRATGLVPQGLRSEDRQRFDQATNDFINAVLRRESGAAIAPSEFDSANAQYIPQPGDSEEVLLQKKQNRDIVTQGTILEAGEGFTELKSSLPPLSVNVGGKQFAVGSIIEANGKRGRVEQDGSITVID